MMSESKNRIFGAFVFLLIILNMSDAVRHLKENDLFLVSGGPWSPFENNWHLKEDYKKVNKRQELAAHLSKHIFYVALANLLLCPIILLWQILYSFFNYAEVRPFYHPGTPAWWTQIMND